MTFGGSGGGSGSIATSSDVALSGLADSQVLTYNGTTSKWTNESLPPSGGATIPGVVQLDSFAGTTDDDKLTAAFSYVQSQTFIPAIQFPDRVVTFSQSRTPFSGMKLIGPGVGQGPKNLELSSGKYSNGRVQLNVGAGTSAWMVGTTTYYDIFVGGIAFQGGSGAQFWHQPLSTGNGLFACQFHSLTFYGFQHVFGQPSNKAALTQVVFSGHWTVLGASDTQFTLGGSDNSLWMTGYLNLDSSTVGGGKFQVIFDSLGKTDVGKTYITSEQGWLGISIVNNCRKLNFYGGENEGRNANTPCDGSVIQVSGGVVSFFGPWCAYAMNNPGTASHGVIEVTGGNVLIDRPCYGRGNLAESVPLVYCSGGKVEVRSAGVDTTDSWTGLPRVQNAGGTVVTDSSVTVI